MIDLAHVTAAALREDQLELTRLWNQSPVPPRLRAVVMRLDAGVGNRHPMEYVHEFMLAAAGKPLDHVYGLFADWLRLNASNEAVLLTLCWLAESEREWNSYHMGVNEAACAVEVFAYYWTGGDAEKVFNRMRRRLLRFLDHQPNEGEPDAQAQVRGPR